MLEDSRQADALIPLSVAHRKAQALLAQFDAGMEIGYPEFTDIMFAMAYSAIRVMPAIQGDIACENRDIWDRISRKSASLKA
jgi:hypothetical protein